MVMSVGTTCLDTFFGAGFLRNRAFALIGCRPRVSEDQILGFLADEEGVGA
jgi:hypothetical protein